MPWPGAGQQNMDAESKKHTKAKNSTKINGTENAGISLKDKMTNARIRQNRK